MMEGYCLKKCIPTERVKGVGEIQLNKRSVGPHHTDVPAGSVDKPLAPSLDPHACLRRKQNGGRVGASPANSGFGDESTESEAHSDRPDAPIFLQEREEGSTKEEWSNCCRDSTRQDQVNKLSQCVTELNPSRMIHHVSKMLRSEAVTPSGRARIE
jgi:hypothetical protein